MVIILGNKIKFSVFADLHYKYGMYISSVENLEEILDRANSNDADFVIHCGDFCNDYIGSPELWNTYLKNKYNLKVYGIYGNHELEAANNSMEFVTSKLTNDKEVVWGTKDQKIGDGSIGYYYFDKNGFRIICLDTNYSFNQETNCWEHNKTCSYGPPAGNIKYNALAPVQLEWLEKVLLNAAEENLKCIIIGHDSFSNIWGSSPDTEKVRELFNRVNSLKENTVIMSLNGHHHTDHVEKQDGIVFLDVNSTINGAWLPNPEKHYFDEHTYICTEYDDDGKPISTKELPLSKAWMSANSWYFEEPLSAIITVEESGKIVIEGMETKWVYGIKPKNEKLRPRITSIEF